MKKSFLKAISVLLCVVFICAASITAFATDSTANFVLSSVVKSGGTDDYVAKESFQSGDVIYIKLTSTLINSLGGLSFYINYDPASFTFIEGKSICMIADSTGDTKYYNDESNEKLTVVYDSGSYNTQSSINGAVFYLAFSVKAFTESKSRTFTFNKKELYDNTFSQNDINSNLTAATTVHLVAAAISNDILALFRKLENIKYPESKDDIDTALNAYNEFSNDQKELLFTNHPSEYGWLSTAVTRYNRLAEQATQANVLSEVEKFKSDHATVLALNTETVALSNEIAVMAANQALGNCSSAAKSYLQNEIKNINALVGRIEELKEIKAEVEEFLGNPTYADIWDKSILNTFYATYGNYVDNIDLALLVYDLLSDESKALVKTEYEWLVEIKEEADKHLANDKAASDLAEKVSAFQKTYLYVFTLNNSNVSESDRSAIKMVIQAYNQLDDEELKQALKTRINRLNSMLELIDDVENLPQDVNDEGETKTNTVTETVTKTVTKEKNIVDTLVKVLKQKSAIGTTILVLFVILAFCLIMLAVAYIFSQKYRKIIQAENINYFSEEVEL